MNVPILATKLYLPPSRTKVVLRPRLIERLNEGLHGKLILISAPAGFGKTTLVSEWVEESKRPTAWLSLDEGDNDPIRFLTYLVTAIQTIAPDFGHAVLALLQSPQPPPTDAILTALLNEIDTISDHFVLVLDDYHMIDEQSIDHAITFLLDHLPPQMHLIITTREDPNLPLARLRARSQLTELRAATLRFTADEAAEFLNQVMNLNLPTEDIATLETRTEGWIAGLQLAAISMQQREDIAQFVRAFAGDNRYIVDYLVEEVLQRQPESVRTFLLQTSILDRFNGSLCDAVTGQQDSHSRLEALERSNFFVTPLDDKRHWYRYHQLFADVLYAHLLAEQPDQVSRLHQRASAWYEHHGWADDAIRHALVARDFERAAGLIERAVPALRRSRQDATLLSWLKALPDTVLQCRPVLSANYGGVLLAGGALESVETRLRDAEQWLDATADMGKRLEAQIGEMVVTDEAAFRLLPGSIAVWRAGLALMQDDVAGTMNYARQALELVPEEDYLGRGGAGGLLGLAYWASGDLAAAHGSFTDAIRNLQKAGNIADAIHGTTVPADIRVAQGRLREAMSTYAQALQLATEQSAPVLWGTADLYVGMSELYREHNELNAATQHLQTSKALCERTGFPQNWSRWHVAMARIREAEGDLDGAIDLLHEAERLVVRGFYPNVRPVAAVKARLWVAQGRLDDAWQWVQEAGLSFDDELSYLREFEHVTLARVMLARYRNDRADPAMFECVKFLERLLHAAEQGERAGSMIEILVLLALAYQTQGGASAALGALTRALALAEPEGYVRLFVDEGSPMAELLEKAAKHGIASNYVRGLLKAFDKVEGSSLMKQNLIEPLSERELDVLRLLGTDMSGPDIARELTLSLNTIRTHTQNIYTKLGVNSRRAAIRRAEELDLF
jgi:LuxR family transcriptional regulator, maltose regulon positive regulatory protein